GMILPGAVATMSTLPNDAQASARQNRAITVAPIARPIGEGGVSVISSAAGRKASSCLLRRTRLCGKAMIFLADLMDARLQVMQLRIATVDADQFVVIAVLDDAAPLNGDNAIRVAHG